MKREIIIGDVHGCFEELQALLKKINYSASEDKLLFLGDLINKGPYSKETLDFVIQGEHRSLLGNHELGFLKGLEDERFCGESQKKLIAQMGKDLPLYCQWMKELPLFIETPEYIAVHGGLEPGVCLKDQKSEIATRIRTWDGEGRDMNSPENPPWFEMYNGTKKVFFGHWASLGLVQRNNVIGLDTGCVWGGELSCYILPQGEVFSVNAFRMYKNPY